MLFQVTSQHPYAEVFIGKPHVYTIDINNLTEVHEAVQAILRQNKVVVVFVNLLKTSLHALLKKHL